jgi:hypothetical protein
LTQPLSLAGRQTNTGRSDMDQTVFTITNGTEPDIVSLSSGSGSISGTVLISLHTSLFSLTPQSTLLMRTAGGSPYSKLGAKTRTFRTPECEDEDIPYTGVPVGTIKKFWTGKGSCRKSAMISEAQARGFNPQDDNDADALAILHYAIAEISI